MNQIQFKAWRAKNPDLVTAIHDYALAQGALGKRTSVYPIVERLRFEVERGIPNGVKPHLQRELAVAYPLLGLVVRG